MVCQSNLSESGTGVQLREKVAEAFSLKTGLLSSNLRLMILYFYLGSWDLF